MTVYSKYAGGMLDQVFTMFNITKPIQGHKFKYNVKWLVTGDFSSLKNEF